MVNPQFHQEKYLFLTLYGAVENQTDYKYVSAVKVEESKLLKNVMLTACHALLANYEFMGRGMSVHLHDG